MRISHRFVVRAPLARVAEFHRRAASLALLTPPPASLRILESPDPLASGSVMRFSLGVGLARIVWTARIEDVSTTGFADWQIAGPFESWTHRHRFVSLDAERTEVVDEITAEVRPEPLRRLLGLAIWASLPSLFVYRAFQTRRLLRRGGAPNTSKARSSLALWPFIAASRRWPLGRDLD